MRYWVLGEFRSGEAALAAIRRLRDQGRRDLDTYSPYPIEGVSEALGLRPSWVRVIGLVAGLVGAVFAYWLQWFCNAADFPINVGGRPLHAYPSFIPITFETTVLFASLAIFFSLMFIYRFPQVHHPVFEVDAFQSASVDGFWVSVTTKSEQEAREVAASLRSLEAAQVSMVEGEPS